MKNNKGQIGLGVVFMVAVSILVGAGLMSSVANGQALLTTPLSVTNETFSFDSCYAYDAVLKQTNVSVVGCNQTLTNVPARWQVNDSAFDVFGVAVINSTTPFTALVDGTDYNLYGGVGIIQYLNTSKTQAIGGNQTLTSYSFYDTGYVKDSSARGIAKLPTVFFALILLSAAVYGIKNFAEI